MLGKGCVQKSLSQQALARSSSALSSGIILSDKLASEASGEINVVPAASSASPTLPLRDSSLFPELLMKGEGKKGQTNGFLPVSKFRCLKFRKATWGFLVLIGSP